MQLESMKSTFSLRHSDSIKSEFCFYFLSLYIDPGSYYSAKFSNLSPDTFFFLFFPNSNLLFRQIKCLNHSKNN